MSKCRMGSAGGDKNYRELAPVGLWRAFILVKDIYLDDFKSALAGIALKDGVNYFGFFTREGEKTLYHFSRYPRHKYGIPSVELCTAAATRLESTLTDAGYEAVLTIDDGMLNHAERTEFRLLLGLREGYDIEQKIHTVEECERMLVGKAASLTPAQIYSIRNGTAYEESAVLIKFASDAITEVYILANYLRQERFTVEDMIHSIAYVVEPPCCLQPDPPVSGGFQP